ncbi:MAG TPA: PIN domain-containing protein [Thermoanaerobaculia bacterium]|nr:PIN domain-containing protein [Thermoanaerobaculia bacterium]
MSLEIAARAGTLDSPGVRDPSDRIIVATAIEFRVPLVTKDARIREAGIVETIW